MMAYDVVIKGGTVVDGTGAPGFAADVAVQDGRIAEVGPGLDGRQVLDAGGHVVAPGFIDIHTHYDAQVFWDPGLTPSSYHGVTTVIAGNCGFSIAPCGPDGAGILGRTLQHVEDMSLDTLVAGVPWDEFEDFGQYLDAVERRGVGLNYGCYVGHTAVRLFVMGEDAYERAATEAEIATMRQIVADAMAAGAAGFATSASPTHNGDQGRPVPSRVADLAELTALAEPLRNTSPPMANRALPGPVDYAQTPDLAQRGLARVQQFFVTLNERLDGRDFVAAGQFSIADITAVVAVDFARIVKVKPSEQHPHLMRWRAAMGERAAMGL